MTNPLYPSLIPRYVDDSWFASDQPVDEIAKLNELEANHEVWIREAQYRSTEAHTPHMDQTGEDEGEGDDEDEVGDEDDPEEEADEGDMLEEDDEDHDDGGNTPDQLR